MSTETGVAEAKGRARKERVVAARAASAREVGAREAAAQEGVRGRVSTETGVAVERAAAVRAAVARVAVARAAAVRVAAVRARVARERVAAARARVAAARERVAAARERAHLGLHRGRVGLARRTASLVDEQRARRLVEGEHAIRAAPLDALQEEADELDRELLDRLLLAPAAIVLVFVAPAAPAARVGGALERAVGQQLDRGRAGADRLELHDAPRQLGEAEPGVRGGAVLLHDVQALEHVDDVVDAPPAHSQPDGDRLQLDGRREAAGEELQEVVAQQTERLVLAAHPVRLLLWCGR